MLRIETGGIPVESKIKRALAHMTLCEICTIYVVYMRFVFGISWNPTVMKIFQKANIHLNNRFRLLSQSNRFVWTFSFPRIKYILQLHFRRIQSDSLFERLGIYVKISTIYPHVTGTRHEPSFPTCFMLFHMCSVLINKCFRNFTLKISQLTF